MTPVSYDHWRAGFTGLQQRLDELVATREVRDVCDVGGGANPLLSLDEVSRRGLHYTVLDISERELAKAPDGYAKVRADIGDPGVSAGLSSSFDLIFSITLAEHVEDAAAFHGNVFSMLRPGGTAAHFMPTMFDPMFVANRVLPETLTATLLRRAQPDRTEESAHGKFPAYYRWCRGPSRRHLRRFEALGYEVEEAIGYFGTGYLKRSPRLQAPYERAVSYLVAHPVDALCSYSWLVLRKPTAP